MFCALRCVCDFKSNDYMMPPSPRRWDPEHIDYKKIFKKWHFGILMKSVLWIRLPGLAGIIHTLLSDCDQITPLFFYNTEFFQNSAALDSEMLSYISYFRFQNRDAIYSTRIILFHY